MLSGGDIFALLGIQFCLSLEPVIHVVSIFPSALLVEFVGAESDFLFFMSFVPGWSSSRGGLCTERHREFLLSAYVAAPRSEYYPPNPRRLTLIFNQF
jgi:hypothetical protein